MDNKAVYSKQDIIQYLSGKGYFIDNFTLNTFLLKWNIEPEYKDDNEVEFYNINVIDTVLNNLFNIQKEQGANMEENFNNEDIKNDIIDISTNNNAEENKKQDGDPFEILQGISLSDGSSLVDRIENASLEDITSKGNETIEENKRIKEEEKEKESKRPGILEGAMESLGKKLDKTEVKADLNDDDLLALSNSFKELEMKEFEANNVKDFEQTLNKSNEINTITKVVSKKIAKYVSAICLKEARSAIKLSEAQEEILRLNQKIRSLEEQNKKLRLLLTESNRNLNSYKPSVFGLYKKINSRK